MCPGASAWGEKASKNIRGSIQQVHCSLCCICINRYETICAVRQLKESTIRLNATPQMLPRSARHGGSLWIFFGPAHFNPLPLDDLVGEEFIDELKVVWLNNLLVSGG
jgi:hypothetical protein